LIGHRHGIGAGNHQGVIGGDGGIVVVAQYEVALVAALGDHAYRLAGVQQSVDGPDGLITVVGQDDDIAATGDLAGGGDLSQFLQGAIKSTDGVNGDAVKAAHTGEAGHGLRV